MPTIPLIRGGETVKTADVPAPVLDNLRRPTVDLSGVISAQGRLGKSAQRPDVPLAIGAAPYDALGSVGQAIERTGSIVGAVALKRQEAQTFNQDFETQLAIKDAAGQMAEVYANPQIPPSEYETHRQRIHTTLADQLGNRKDFTPEARERAGQRLRMWDVDSRHDANLNRTKEDFQRARDNTLAVMEDAENNGRPDVFTDALRRGIDNGWIHKSEGVRATEGYRQRQKTKEKEAKAEASEARLNSEGARIYQDPAKWIEEHPAPAEGEDIRDYNRLLSLAEGVRRDQAADAVEDVNTLIVEDKIHSSESIDALEGPQYTPLLREELKNNLAKYNKQQSDIIKAEKGVENFARMWVNLDKVDFAAIPDADARAAEFAKWMGLADQTLPDDLASEAKKRLRTMLGATVEDDGKGRPELERQVTDGLKAMYDNWDFGPTMRFVGPGKPGATPRGNVPDTGLELAAQERFAKAQRQMHEFFKAYPKANETAVRERLAQVRAENRSLSGSKISIETSPAVPAPTDWGKYVPELKPVEPKAAPAPKPAEPEPDQPPPKTTAKEEADALKGMTKKQREEYDYAKATAEAAGVPFLTKAQQLKEERELNLKASSGIMLPAAGEPSRDGNSLLPLIEIPFKQ